MHFLDVSTRSGDRLPSVSYLQELNGNEAPDSSQIDCSLVIPAHNEASRISETLRVYHRALARRFDDAFEILVIANGCLDDTAAVCAALTSEFPRIRITDISEAIGKGGAVLKGLRQAKGDRVLFADADGSTAPESLLALSDALDDHDVAIGSRRLPQSIISSRQGLERRVLSHCFRFAVHHLLDVPFHDTQCGAKAFRGSILPDLIDAVHEQGWAFDVDLLLSARHSGLRISEVPVNWADRGGSSLRILPTIRQVGTALVRLKQRHSQRGRYSASHDSVELSTIASAGCLQTTQRMASDQPLRILAMNWRCLRHPQAGGAEVNIFEQAQRWARDGHDVTVFTSDPGRRYAPTRFERLNGVNVHRIGGQFSVYLHAALFLMKNGSSFDRIIDVENGIPFFTPLFTRQGGALLVHHVHDHQWFVEFNGLIGRLGRYLECRLMPAVYQNWPVIAVSPTTRDTLVEIGFNANKISVVYNGVNIGTPGGNEVRSSGQVAYVGRLKRYKRVDQLVDTFAAVCTEFPEAHLHIVGDGDAREEIEERIHSLQLKDKVTLHGFVDEETKLRILSTAAVFATPSMQEGWGLSVIEANALGCPAVAYDVPGLKAAIRHGETGLLAQNRSEFRNYISLMLRDAQLRDRYSLAAVDWAGRFNWDTSAAMTLRILSGQKPLEHTDTVQTSILEMSVAD